MGTLGVDVETGAAMALGEPELRIEGAAGAQGVRPGGLDRPPKPSANLS